MKTSVFHANIVCLLLYLLLSNQHIFLNDLGFGAFGATTTTQSTGFGGFGTSGGTATVRPLG